MLFTFVVVMAGIVLLTMVVNNRRSPSRWDSHRWPRRRAGNGPFWTDGSGGYSGHVGADCGVDAGGCDGGGGGGGD
jgi:hypothetical protein